MNNKRPVNLDLTTLHFPIMAITSIMHRISGMVVFILLPFMFYFLQQSLASPESFKHLHLILSKPIYKLMLWVFWSSLTYHFMAGVRHMFADYGHGETVAVAKKTAIILLALTVLTTVFIGVWIW